MEIRDWQILSLVSAILIITMPLNPVITQSEEFVWQVNAGDKMVYVFTEVYTIDNFDGDNNPSTYLNTYRAENGELINYTVKEGTRLVVEILEFEAQVVGPPIALLNLTFGEVSIHGRYTDYVRPTYLNKSYWENVYDGLQTYSDLNITKYEYSLEGDKYTETVESQRGTETWWFNRTRNWKTGWLTYRRYRISNKTTILSEIELTMTPLKVIIGFETIPLLVGIIILTINFRRKQRRS